MAVITWFATSSLVNNQQEMSETSPGTEVTATGPVGWIAGNASGNRSPLNSGVEQILTTFVGTTDPDGTPDTTTGDCLRSTNTYNGTFPAGNWNVHFACRATTATGCSGRIICRLLRGTDVNGSGATEINAGEKTGSTVTNLQTGATQTSTATFDPGQFTVTNEYIFIQIAWERTGAGGHATSDVNMRIGTTGTRVISTNFTANQTLTSTAVYSDADTFQTPTVAAGSVELTASLYTDADTFFAPNVSHILTQSAIYTDADTFHTAEITVGAVNLTAAIYEDADVFHAPTVATAGLNLQPALYEDADAFFAATITTGAVSLTPALYADADTFHAATVAVGAVNLAPALYDDADTFYSPSVGGGAAQDLAVDLYDDTDIFFGVVVDFERRQESSRPASGSIAPVQSRSNEPAGAPRSNVQTSGGMRTRRGGSVSRSNSQGSGSR